MVAEGSSTLACQADRLDHILQAVHHLEAAGLQGQADQLRQECDGQLRQAANQMKTVETEIARLRDAADAQIACGRASHQQQPVVTAALARPHTAEEHKYAVQQAGYMVPAETTERTAPTFDERPLPEPFVPQPIIIEPIKVFGEPSDSWGIKPTPDVNSPFSFGAYIFTPDNN
jgi:ATPase subunit of ABC transporter with duplicated ATPase domains